MSSTWKNPQRVASLLPSASEIVALLGCADRLVGVSHECDYPAELASIPVLTSSRLKDLGTSRGIDLDVRHLVSEVLSIYSVDAQALEQAKPDLVITQDLCEVCAVSIDDVKAAVARLAHRDAVEVVTVSPTRLLDVMDDICRIARVLGVPQRGEQEVNALLERIEKIRQGASQAKYKPRVVSIEWLDPIMLGGTWMPELIELAGGEAVGSTAGGPAPTVTREELAQLRPEVLLLKPCGFSIERSLQERALIDELCASLAQGPRVFLADGSAYFNRSGPRLVESVEILAACLHPEFFPEFEQRHQAAYLRLQ